MTDYASLTLDEYLTQLASSDPTPGGGAVAAIAGAQAAALMEMVCNLTKGKDFDHVSDEINLIQSTCMSARTALLGLASQDAKAFDSLLRAYRLPSTSTDEKSARSAQIKTDLEQAARVPLQVMDWAVQLAPMAKSLAEIANKKLITDVGIAVFQLHGIVQSARLNILINTKSMKDSKLAAALEVSLEDQTSEFHDLIEGAVATVESRMI